MRCFLVPLTALLLTPALAIGQAPAKKRIAIMNFDYATVHSGVALIFGTDVDVGRGIADLLVDRFVQDGVYAVYERKALDKLIQEQNFSNSNRADPSSAAKIGKMLGVEAIVIGSITQFGRDDKTTNIGGLGRVTGRYGIGSVGKRESKAVVQISARLVNVGTGEVMAVASGKGESTRSGTALLGAGGTSGTTVAGAGDMQSRNFAATILGEAVNQAVTGVAKQLEQNAGRLPTTVVTVDGLVADVTGNTLVLNVGTRAGVKVGDKLAVMREGRAITDPATGKVLRRNDTKLGEVTITEADEVSSVGTYSGPAGVKVGDRVKTP